MATPLQIIDDHAAVKALSDATRREMVVRLAREPLSITQLARMLKKTPATMHYHIKRLEGSGLVRLVETRIVNNNLREKRYGLTTDARCVVGYSMPPPARGPVPPKRLGESRAIVALDETCLVELLEALGVNESALSASDVQSALSALAQVSRGVFREAFTTGGVPLPADVERRLEAFAAAFPAAILVSILEDEGLREGLHRLFQKVLKPSTSPWQSVPEGAPPV